MSICTNYRVLHLFTAPVRWVGQLQCLLQIPAYWTHQVSTALYHGHQANYKHICRLPMSAPVGALTVALTAFNSLQAGKTDEANWCSSTRVTDVLSRVWSRKETGNVSWILSNPLCSGTVAHTTSMAMHYHHICNFNGHKMIFSARFLQKVCFCSWWEVRGWNVFKIYR